VRDQNVTLCAQDLSVRLEGVEIGLSVLVAFGVVRTDLRLVFGNRVCNDCACACLDLVGGMWLNARVYLNEPEKVEFGVVLRDVLAPQCELRLLLYRLRCGLLCRTKRLLCLRLLFFPLRVDFVFETDGCSAQRP
jgi:hypothetical protein